MVKIACLFTSFLLTGPVMARQSPDNHSAGQTTQPLVDAYATAGTVALATNLRDLSGKGILFGHQHTTEYGHGWSGEADRSDVRSVTGDYPAVTGVDFSGLSGRGEDAVKVYADALQKTIRAAYDRNQVITIAWHMANPVIDPAKGSAPNSFYWNDTNSIAAVPLIIPGGSSHEAYKNLLRRVAGVLHKTTGSDGKPVPMIFRPFHEMDGDWFWWGRRHCTADEFRSLWRFTVTYLRDSLDIHQLIYAFSPDCKFTTEQEYLERYPGDKWVDLVGTDNYYDMGRDGRYDLPAAVQKLKIIGAYAKRSGKLVAFTETGLESIPDTSWWTGSLLRVIRESGVPMCYTLVWRNDATSATHFYAPYPGQASVPDFMRFFNDQFTYFNRDLPPMYTLKGGPVSQVRIATAHDVSSPPKLRVIGTQLSTSAGQPVVLRGMSFGWHNLWPRFYNAGAVHQLVKDWHCNVVRAAMGIQLNDSGYLKNPVFSKDHIRAVINAAIAEGIYVIVDWHDHNLHPAQATTFFNEISSEYAGYPNIIYELYNEPDYETWPEVKKYAEDLIATIRRNDPDNVILVGCPHWDQDIQLPAADPIQGVSNIMYTMHFYAGTHKQWLRDRTDDAIAKGLPVFVSESAGMEATGDGPLDVEEWNRWIAWMESRKISWITWSVSDKAETCSVLKPSAKSSGKWRRSDLKESGVRIREVLRGLQ